MRKKVFSQIIWLKMGLKNKSVVKEEQITCLGSCCQAVTYTAVCLRTFAHTVISEMINVKQLALIHACKCYLRVQSRNCAFV